MKKKRGRKPNAVRSTRVVISGWLHPQYDADILAWLQSIPKGQRMNAFKTALRSGGMTSQDLPAEPDEDAARIADEILGAWEF